MSSSFFAKPLRYSSPEPGSLPYPDFSDSESDNDTDRDSHDIFSELSSTLYSDSHDASSELFNTLRVEQSADDTDKELSRSVSDTHDISTELSTPVKPCKARPYCVNYTKFGSCRYGEKCMFRHMKVAVDLRQRLQQRPIQGRPKGKHCHEFYKTGLCGQGPNCPYPHIPCRHPT
jgi:hypothetical protein